MKYRIAALILPFAVLALAACAAKQYPPSDVTISYFRSKEAQVESSWSPDGKHIAYSVTGADGYTDVHVSDVNGANDVNLTANVPQLPSHNVGGAIWYPSGQYIAVLAEKPVHTGTSFEATPGFGAYTDYWLVSVDGRAAYPLTDVPNDSDHGVLFGAFSRDGKKLVWAERVESPNIFVSTFGTTVLKLADVVMAPRPHLENTRVFSPGGRAFYETYGFSPDGSRIIFCSQMGGASIWDQNIYTMDLNGGDIRKLTDSNYNEHAVYTPNGKHIVWMTNTDNSGGTDWWIMNADGTGKRRLTYLNESGHPDYAGESVWAGLPSFNPDGTKFISGFQTSLFKQVGKIVIVSTKNGQPF